MKLLLDTHLLLWAAGEPGRLPATARALIEDPAHDLIFSAASLWEIADQGEFGRSDFRIDPALFRRSLFDNGYAELVLSGTDAVAIANLPHLHRDPFDRMLVAQAMVEGLTLVTTDLIVTKYPGRSL